MRSYRRSSGNGLFAPWCGGVTRFAVALPTSSAQRLNDRPRAARRADPQTYRGVAQILDIMAHPISPFLRSKVMQTMSSVVIRMCKPL